MKWCKHRNTKTSMVSSITTQDGHTFSDIDGLLCTYCLDCDRVSLKKVKA